MGLAHVLHGKVGHGGSGQAEFPQVNQSVHPAVLILPDSNFWEAVYGLHRGTRLTPDQSKIPISYVARGSIVVISKVERM